MSHASIDWLVLTAANRTQARGYEAQLAARVRDGRLDAVRNFLVVPDPMDRRVGSGGSTSTVLHELAKRLQSSSSRRRSPSPFDGQRILIIHSGGDSRRLPAYAAEGKVFVPLPCTLDSGHSATLFDLILADLAPLVRTGRVLIATGDVLLGVGKHNPDLSAPGMVGVAFPGDAVIGSRHGVYVCNRTGRVTDFLQKPDLNTARRRNALTRRGELLIDTGILSLDSAAAAQWTRASTALVRKLRAGRGDAIDLYSDILPALFGRGRPRSGFTRYHVPFHAAIVPPCDFLHIGSTIELLTVATTMGSGRHEAVTLNSVVSAPLTQHPTSLVESSHITHRTRLGNHSMLVGFPGGFPLDIGDHMGMVFLPIGRSHWTCIAFGVKDDFKTPFGHGGTIYNCRVFAQTPSMDDPLARCTLWDLGSWIVGPLKTVMRFTRWMVDARAPSPSPGSFPRRWSMAELMPRINIDRLLEHRHALQSERCSAEATALLRRGRTPPAHVALAALKSTRPAVIREIKTQLAKERHPFRLARLHHLASRLDPARSASHDALAFRCIADGVATSSPRPPLARTAAIARGQIVTVTAPVRIDLCGGWSDTPPICHELGGTVVNAAITLEGRHPVQVTAHLIPDPAIHLRSDDLRKSLTITHTREALSHHDPHDWAALPKAALILAGITPQRGSLRRRLQNFGGGVELTMSVAVPKGSGLGTSSILGASVLACLDRLCGQRPNTRRLIARTSILEQMMSTAGGWQDQAGGITPGVKILRTRPGSDQVPWITSIRIPPRAMTELRARSILYYTGQRRLARDILHGVVRRYLASDPATLRIIHNLKSAAEAMARDLSRSDIDAFAAGLLRNWELKKAIDPGSTNPLIESILAPLLPHLSGYELAGAGGGGFLLLIARSPRVAAHIRASLTPSTPSTAGIVDFDFDRRGLNVAVSEAAPA